MKKIICLLLVFIMLFSITSCSEKQEVNADSFKILTTIFPFYSFATAITSGAENVSVEMLIDPGAEVHTYSPDAEDVYEYINSDVFIRLGGETDSWTNDLISQSDIVHIISTIDGIETLKIENEYHEDHNHEIDEHIWTSPRNAMIIVQKICDELCKFDSKNSNIYTKNTENYLISLNELDKQLNDIFEKSQDRTLIFEGVFPFRYFVNDYNLNWYSGLDGCDGSVDISAQKLDFLINVINDSSVKTVFYTEFSEQKIADKLCGITKANKSLLHSCHNVTKEEFENRETYLTLMQKNVDTLNEIFNNK